MFLNRKELEVLKDYIYTSCESLDVELKNRSENEELQRKVKDFFGTNFVNEIGGPQRAVLARTIFTPNLEFEYFLDVIKEFNLNPLLLEYGGKFVAKNLEKYYLCKLFFRNHVGKNGGMLFDSKKIVNFNTEEGKDFSKVKTLSGESIIDFHHGLLDYKYGQMTGNIVQFSDWFNKTRYLTDHYYFYFFSLFVCNGVLFENFLIDDKEESVFIKDHVFSGFKKVHEYFGVKPLIVPLLPIENEKFRTWFSYSPQIKHFVDENGV